MRCRVVVITRRVWIRLGREHKSSLTSLSEASREIMPPIKVGLQV